MGSDLLAGIATACEPSALVFTIVGTILGIIFGALPGLTSTMAVALLIPLTYSLEPVAGMGMLVAGGSGNAGINPALYPEHQRTPGGRNHGVSSGHAGKLYALCFLYRISHPKVQ